jgi:hypothetical protein
MINNKCLLLLLRANRVCFLNEFDSSSFFGSDEEVNPKFDNVEKM